MSEFFKIVVRQLKKYKLELVRVKKVGWTKGSTEAVENCMFFYGNENANNCLGTGFCLQERNTAAFCTR
jgi:hypothetical protein